MNFSLDILFLQKKLFGKNYKLNIKPKYSKILKKPIIFYLILSFLSENEIFELYFTCKKFKNLIIDDPFFENQVLKLQLKLLKKKNTKNSTVNNSNSDINHFIYNNYIQNINKKLQLSFIINKIMQEKNSKIKVLEEIINNSYDNLTICYLNKKKTYEIDKFINKKKNVDKERINEIYIKLVDKELKNYLEKEIEISNQIKNNNSIDLELLELLNKYRYNENKSPSSIENLKNYSERNIKLKELNSQIQNFIKYNENENKNNLIGFEKIKKVPLILYQNLLNIKEITFNREDYVIRNLDIKKK